MSKRLSFLFIILLLSLSATVYGQTPIDVNNYSFEMLADGNQVTCHGGLNEDDPYPGVKGWTGGEEAGAATDWSGVDVNCGVEGMCEDCRDWHVFPDGNVVAYLDMGTYAYQLTDETVTVGHKYVISFDGMTWWSEEGWTQPIRASFYYLEDVCAPDEHTSVSETIHVVTGYEYDCGGGPDQCLDDWEYDLKAVYVVTASDPAVGEKLGIKIGSPSVLTYPGSNWAWVDNIHLSWQWATEAYDPNPGDGAELVSKNPTLKWTPGLWAEQHEVYFGTDETAVANADSSDTTGIYIGAQGPNDYTPSGPLVLGETYYWKITEINSTPPGGGIPAPPWEGAVWSFRVEGNAYNPSPEAGAVDVPFLGLELEWTAGADAEHHDVYFGTDVTAVADANTNSPEHETTLSVGTETYAITEELDVGETYYWRIDEKSAGGSHIVKGDLWGFTVGAFLVVDNFESYTKYNLTDVWDDYWVNGSDGEIYLEWDVNIVRDRVFNPQAVLCEYRSSDKDDGVYFDVQDMSELEIGSDWTIGGVKALQLWMRGDADTVVKESGGEPDYREAWPWVELEDTDSNSGYVLYPAETITDILSPNWHEWNIDLGIFDACGVDLMAIDRFTIGIGGDKANQKQTNDVVNSMWFDDIRLYPPRCRPALSEAVGDFTGDCSVKYDDLDIMTTDWLLTDGNIATENRPAILTGFPNEPTSHWVTGYIGGAIEVNEGYNIDINDPRLYGLESMSITAWVKPIVGMERWVGIVCSRETPCDEGGEATELGIYGSDWGGPDGLGYDWSCLSDAWKWDAEVDITDGTWTFVAMAVDPTGCTLYARPEGGALLEGTRNWVEHPPQQSFAKSFMIGRSNADGGYFVGAIDDVRIYTYTLDINDVNNLAYQTAEPEPAPVYWYKFDDGSGYTADDSGTTTEVYMAVPSIANMTDPEPKLQRAVNFADYAILADNWMSEDFWP